MALYFMIQYVNGNNERKMIINSSEEKFKANLAKISDNGFELIKKCKLYPIGSWNRYQHVFYNLVDRANNSLYDAIEEKDSEAIDKAHDFLAKAEDALGKFDCGFKDVNGMVYVEYEDYKFMKDVIGAYACRHNGYV